MTNRKHQNLNINTLNRLSEIFRKNNWVKDDYQFDRFCKTLAHLTMQQQELILELTSHYLKIPFNNYIREIRGNLSQIGADNLRGIEQIYIFPLSLPEKLGKSNRSAEFMARFFYGDEIYSHEIFEDRKLIINERLGGIPNNVNQKPCKLFLVDDFVGSGETASSVLKYLIDDKNVDKNKMIVLCLVGQEEGIAKIKSLGVNVFCLRIRQKGITDKYESPIKESYLKIMKEIEDLLRVKKEERFGYMGSEALVTLMKTPNNTFPVYWYETTLRDGKKFQGPFKRF